MADNVAITAGSGTTVATDDVSGAHYQRVKLAVGVADSTVMVGHLEDSAHSSGDGGVMALAVRQDTATALAGTDGDYIPLIVDSAGKLWIANADLATLAGAVSGSEMQCDVLTQPGTAAEGAALPSSFVVIAGDDGTDTHPVQVDASGQLKVSIEADNAGIGGGTQYTEDAAAPANPVGNALMAERDDALGGLTPAEGDWTHLYCDANGALWIAAASLPLPSGAATSANQSTANTALSAIQTAVELIDTVGGGTEAAAMRVTIANDSTGVVSVDDNGSTLSVDDGGGSLTVDGTVGISGTVTVDMGSNNDVQGDVAHDSADSGNPVKIGAKARTANPTAVANGDRVDLFSDDVGKLVVLPNAPRDLVTQQTTDTTTTSETTILTAGGAGVFLDLTQLVITNASATATVVTLKDSTTGTTRGKYALAANGGIVLNFQTPFKQGTANNNWTATSSATVNLHYVVQAIQNV